MFAGIGYFSIPLAVHGGVKSIFSIEKNPNSYAFLKQNIELNGVSHVATAILGDNRLMGQEIVGKADRVLMGYIPTPKQFLKRARDFLGPKGGIIHYHHTCSKEDMKTLAQRHVEEELGGQYVLLDFRVVKSYSPKQYHCVADFQIA
jgi:tRNA wybutosine-synthesizing protein 2